MPSSCILCFFLDNFEPFWLLIQIREKFTLRIRLKSVLQFSNYAKRHLKLLLLENKAFFFFIDYFNSLLNLIFKIKGKSFKSEFNICDFFEPEINKVFIICSSNFLVIGVNFALEERGEILFKVFSLWCGHSNLDMAEDDEVIDAWVLVRLKLLLEELPFAIGAELVE